MTYSSRDIETFKISSCKARKKKKKKKDIFWHFPLSEEYAYPRTPIVNPFLGHFETQPFLYNQRFTGYEKSYNFIILSLKSCIFRNFPVVRGV